MTQKAKKYIKENINKIGLHQNENIYYIKNTFRERKKEATVWEKIFSNPHNQERNWIKKPAISTVRKHIIQLENRKKYTWIDISLKNHIWIANKYMKIWSTSLSPRMQIESSMSYNSIKISAITILTY